MYDRHEVTPPELIALLVDKGPALARSAGASGIAAVDMSGDRVSIRFAPPYGLAGPPSAANGRDAPTSYGGADEGAVSAELDALDDPATYEDGHVPGYEIDPDPAEEAPP